MPPANPSAYRSNPRTVQKQTAARTRRGSHSRAGGLLSHLQVSSNPQHPQQSQRPPQARSGYLYSKLKKTALTAQGLRLRARVRQADAPKTEAEFTPLRVKCPGIKHLHGKMFLPLASQYSGLDRFVTWKHSLPYWRRRCGDEGGSDDQRAC